MRKGFRPRARRRCRDGRGRAHSQLPETTDCTARATVSRSSAAVGRLRRCAGQPDSRVITSAWKRPAGRTAPRLSTASAESKEGHREPTYGTVHCLVPDRATRGVRPVGHALATLVTHSVHRCRSERLKPRRRPGPPPLGGPSCRGHLTRLFAAQLPVPVCRLERSSSGCFWLFLTAIGHALVMWPAVGVDQRVAVRPGMDSAGDPRAARLLPA